MITEYALVIGGLAFGGLAGYLYGQDKMHSKLTGLVGDLMEAMRNRHGTLKTYVNDVGDEGRTETVQRMELHPELEALYSKVVTGTS